MNNPSEFVQWFRSAAPYIRTFRGQTFVIAFDGEVIEDGNFVELTHDINLLASIGVKIVLVHGARPQIERTIKSKNVEPLLSKHGIRITDERALSCVKEANGRLRLEIEALLSMGLPNTPLMGSEIRVSSGNFVIAKPKGIVDGEDMLFSGDVRKIHHLAIKQRLDNNELVLISPIGYSPTGEIFNLTHEDVAAEVAINLNASKLIFLVNSCGQSDADGKLLRELTSSELKALHESKYSFAEQDNRVIANTIKASESGVDRVHLINRSLDGAMLLELFTHEGIGSMISRDPLEKIRKATVDDVGGILSLIEPLENAGVLIRRPRENLENEIQKFTVVEHDGLIAGTVALNTFVEASKAELACLAVHPAFQNAGVGERLLRIIEQDCSKLKINEIFVLTTASSHWFLENGFKQASMDTLPKEKAALYNYERNSKIYTKHVSA